MHLYACTCPRRVRPSPPPVDLPYRRARLTARPPPSTRPVPAQLVTMLKLSPIYNRGVNLRTICDEMIPPSLWGDRTVLTRGLLNLVSRRGGHGHVHVCMCMCACVHVHLRAHAWA